MRASSASPEGTTSSGARRGFRVSGVSSSPGKTAFTRIPDAAPYVKGVINLRSEVIPVVDARARFRMELAEYASRTCIVVVQAGSWPVGVVVDRVCDVVAIPEADTQLPPPGAGGPDQFLAGIGKIGAEVRLLLDVDRFLAGASPAAA